MLGTNPLTAGSPTDEEFPFLIDCATSIIQRGKVEVYDRLKKPLPEGLVINDEGNGETNPTKILEGLSKDKAALLPLGGKGEETGGYKGFGYSTLVEILSAALSDGIYLKDTIGIMENGKKRLKVGHFFLAINIESFLPLRSFKKTAGNIMKGLRNSKKEPGQNRIYTAGEKEFYAEKERSKKGIPINKSIQRDIKIMKEELDLKKYNFSF
jgi:LDH2 family malate/lactate/ureidoglycolate dehydrogenase